VCGGVGANVAVDAGPGAVVHADPDAEAVVGGGGSAADETRRVDAQVPGAGCPWVPGWLCWVNVTPGCAVHGTSA
jgi:hypothetical protein